MSDTNHSLPAGAAPAKASTTRDAGGHGLFSTEDWWAVWIGLFIVVVAWGLFAGLCRANALR